MMSYFDEIKRLIQRDQFMITKHARIRMFERDITTDMIIEMITNRQVIEEYPDDFPCPSYLILGFCNETPLHVVLALCSDHVRIITVYKPDKSRWKDYTKRK